jgi:hypothetical protein
MGGGRGRVGCHVIVGVCYEERVVTRHSLLPFLQSGTPPKGILFDSSSFLPFGEESFLIFLQFEPPLKGMLFTYSKGTLHFLFIPLFPAIKDCFPP